MEASVVTISSGYLVSGMTAAPYNSSMGQFRLDKSFMSYLFKEGPTRKAQEMVATIAFLHGDESTYVMKLTRNRDGGWLEGS